jgi:hypothetical protein
VPRDERPLDARVTDPSVPTAIESGTLEILGLLPNSSNYTFLARATGHDGEQELAVYKPQRGESPLWDFPQGSLCKREVAAYVVAREIGWPDVPQTVLRDGPEGTGSVQRFIPFEPHEHYFTLQDRFPEAFMSIAVFDLVVNNADRKGGHCLLGEDGRVWAIDHGVCFHEDPKLRTVIWEFMDRPIPDALVADVRRLAESLADGRAPCDELSGLLDPAEIVALRRRASSIVSGPVFPSPIGSRPYPWPPV